MNVQSALAHCLWPAVPTAGGAQMLAALYQLESSQWLPPEDLQVAAMTQLQVLLEDAFQNIAWWRAALQGVGFQPGRALASGDFRRMPRLSRADVQNLREALVRPTPISPHERREQGHTSGSTGMPVSFLQTDLTQHFWRAFTLREHLWHERDFSGKLAAIRSNVEAGRADHWGPATAQVLRTGPSVSLNIRTPVDEQLLWLVRENPDYLITHPSNLHALALRAMERRLRLPRLKQLRTFGEVLSLDTRKLCESAWGVDVADIYSSEEAGCIALQCRRGAYHVQAENLLVEILHDDGRACAPGEIGRVVITTLHNFAMPLIRYDIGDYARVGPPCACGRGLPVLQEILGRQRNMLTLPDGSQHWPSFPEARWVGIAPLRQVQLVQRAADLILMRVVAPRPLTHDEAASLVAVFQETLRFPHRIDIERVPEIPRGANGKFEDFLSEMA